MNKEIEEMISKCTICEKYSNSNCWKKKMVTNFESGAAGAICDRESNSGVCGAVISLARPKTVRSAKPCSLVVLPSGCNLQKPLYSACEPYVSRDVCICENIYCLNSNPIGDPVLPFLKRTQTLKNH